MGAEFTVSEAQSRVYQDSQGISPQEGGGVHQSLRVSPLRLHHVVTLRGLALLGFVAFLLSGPVPEQADIISTILAYSLLCLVLFSVLSNLANALYARHQLKVHVHPGKIESSLPNRLELNAYSNIPQRTLLSITNASSLPFLYPSIQVQFERAGVRTTIHQILGKMSRSQYVSEDTLFPHRGTWRIKNIRVILQDYLGLSSIEWRITGEEAQRSFRVGVPLIPSDKVPIISSATRAGDTLSDVNEHQGELFDLKQYHPSDGMKRIVWKVYAKSGELVSRHPERSMTPEGSVVLFVLAAKNGDSACGAALDYIHRLHELGLEIYVGAEGMGSASPARDMEQSERIFLDSVWAAESTVHKESGDNLHSLIGHYQETHPHTPLTHVLIFCSETLFESHLGLRKARCLGEALAHQGIKPVFCIHRRNKGNSSSPPPSLFKQHFYEFLFRADDQKTALPESHLSEFTKICSQSEWQAILFL